MLPPGYVCSDKLMTERAPASRPSWKALALASVWNSFVPDQFARRIISTTFGLTQMAAVPFPALNDRALALLAHAALRLTCNHAGYGALWREQLDDAWRSGNPPMTWPVLVSDDARWDVRSAIDAVVADAYGLSRDHYAHVLSTFSHKSYPKAPTLCLAKFDELTSIGLEAFTRKHDPYWDIPLNENLPQPVIELPLPADSEAAGSEAKHLTLDLMGGSSSPRRKERRAAPSGATGFANAQRVAGQEVHGGITGGMHGALPLAAETAPRSAERPSTGGLWNSSSAGDSSRRFPAGNSAEGQPAEPPSRRSSSAGALEPAAFDRVKALLAERQVITSADVQYILATDAAGARPYLQALITQGLAIIEGQRRGTRYRAKGTTG